MTGNRFHLTAFSACAAMGLSLAACGPASAQMVAACPAKAPAAAGVVKGARMLGAIPPGAPLRDALATAQSPAQVRADGDLLAELDSESEDVRGERRTSTWVETTSTPASLACIYGPAAHPGRGTAMLLLPLPARSTAECLVVKDVRRVPGSRLRGVAASCRRTRD